MESASNRADCQVLVVGAGPTGLILASELLARGIRTRIIDKGDGVVLETRALGVHARTLEMLDMMGLADQFVARGHKVHCMRMYSRGKQLVELNYALNGSQFDFMLDIPQHVTEKLLRQHVAELGGVVEGSTELVALSQEPDRVIATVKNCMGEIDEISADYVVGCDGAHSRVRREVGLSFDGLAYEEDWLLADVLLDWNRSEEEVHAFFRPDGLPMICFPMRDHVWRVVFPYTGDRGRQPPTLEEIQELANQRAPEPVHVSHPTWLANFRCSLRSAPEYRRGRVMLAGDAVHVHTPAGGQGMNTGMQDAHNLAWKLALVVSGRSPETLLNTYGEERAPVGADVLALTHGLVRIATVRNPFKRALRDVLVPLASRITPIQRRAVRRMSQVHLTYRSSSLTPPGSRSNGVRPGDRAPDAQVVEAGGRSRRLYEVLRSGRHVLVGTSVECPDELREWDSMFETVCGSHRSVCLIRPDGYVAASGIPGIKQYLRAVFAQPDAAPFVGESWRRGAVLLWGTGTSDR